MKKAFRLKNVLSEIEPLAAGVLAFGRESGLTTELAWEIRLVLEEIVTNIISYGYEDTADHEIEIGIADTGEEIIIRIRDDARPFNLLAHPAPDLEIPLEDREIGGMGIHMVREIMDEINYKREKGGNLVVLRRRKE